MSYTVYGFVEDREFVTDNEYWVQLATNLTEDQATQRALQSPRSTAIFPSNIWVRELACPDCSGPVIDGDNMSGVKCSECPWWFCY